MSLNLGEAERHHIMKRFIARVTSEDYLMPQLEDAVIISACRTPVGKFQGGLADLSAPELGALVVREAVKRAKLDAKQIDECIMGLVVAAGLGQNPARQAARKGALPPEV